MHSHSILYAENRRDKLIVLALSVLFVVGFHAVFQPFQMRFYPIETKALVITAYGIITMVVVALGQFLIPVWKPRWMEFITARKLGSLIWIALHILGIAVLIFAFKVVGGFYTLSWERVGTGILAMMAVGSIPLGSYLIWKWRQREALPAPAKTIELKAIRGDQQFLCDPQSILFLEARGNYVHIQTDTELLKLRSTLAHVSSQLEAFPEFVTCHRAFVVNFESVSGLESQNGRPHLKIGEQLIPVSRSKLASIKALIS